MDKGFVKIRLGHRDYSVSQGQFVLIAPNQPHAVLPSATVAPFYITVHFQTNLHRLGDLTDAVNQGSEEGRHLLTKLLREKASSAYGANVLARCYIAEFAGQCSPGHNGQPTRPQTYNLLSRQRRQPVRGESHQFHEAKL